MLFNRGIKRAREKRIRDLKECKLTLVSLLHRWQLTNEPGIDIVHGYDIVRNIDRLIESYEYNNNKKYSVK